MAANVRQRTDPLAKLSQIIGKEGAGGAQTPAASPVSIHGRNGIMNRIIWLVGAVVIILLVLGFFGLR